MDTTAIVNSPGVFAVVMLFTVAYIACISLASWRRRPGERAWWVVSLFLAAPVTAYCVFFAVTTKTASSLFLVAIWSVNVGYVLHRIYSTRERDTDDKD